MARTGRPTKFRLEFVEQAEALAKFGATDADMAAFFKVDIRTFDRWKLQHEHFRRAVKRGKDVADSVVEERLFQRATGYSHDAVKIFQHEGKPVQVDYVEHYPPDTTAAIFWLKNRRPEQWRDKQVVEHDGKVQIGADAAFADLVAALESAVAGKAGGSGS